VIANRERPPRIDWDVPLIAYFLERGHRVVHGPRDLEIGWRIWESRTVGPGNIEDRHVLGTEQASPLVV
jgi:hypothetical protein